MKFLGIRKVLPGRFITRYDIEYETAAGTRKIYEAISRSPDMTKESDLVENRIDAIVLILTDETGEKLLLNREFRMATGVPVFNFPAGLIEPGEEPREAARRELREETGLNLTEVRDVLAPSYSAVGFSNEKNLCLIGTASGEFHPSTSPEEEIRAGWYTKAEVRELLKTSAFSGRTQGFCYMWSRT